MLRDAISQDTPIGRKAAPYMEDGGLVPDSVLLELIQERLSQPDCARGYILDGYPRTLRQAEDYETLADLSRELVIFSVEVPRQELLRRLSGRRWCPTCQATYHVDNRPPKREGLCDRDGTAIIQREDDKEWAVARRLADYDERTQPLVEYYQSRARFHTIDGSRSMDTVFGELKGLLEEAAR
jgi:adenylate kinase